MRDLFKLFREHLRIVVLNACYSEEQAKEISKEIDWVVGMSSGVSDSAAVEFAAGFYQALAYGQNVRNAVEQGRVAVKLDGIAEGHAPCLLVRRGTVSDRPLGKPANGHATRSISNQRDVVTLPSAVCTSESQRRYVIKLEASLSDINPELVQELTKLLRECTGDMTLTIEKIEEGSVILKIATTKAGGDRLVNLRDSGRLEDLAGLHVTSVQEQADAHETVKSGATVARNSVSIAVGSGGAGHVAVAFDRPGGADWPGVVADQPHGAIEKRPTAAEFESPFTEHLPALRRVARVLCRGSGDTDAEDLVQEALVRALVAQHVPDPSRTRAWLMAILRNTFVDRIGHRTRSRSVVLQDVSEAQSEIEPLPWEDLSDDDIRRAIANLPDDLRTTYRMFALKTRPYAEIARLLGIPPSTVGARLIRARRLLRAMLAKQLMTKQTK